MDICDCLENLSTSSTVEEDIDNISVSDKRELRTERAEVYFEKILWFLNTKTYDFQKLEFLNIMYGVFQNYYTELFPDDWEEMYSSGSRWISCYRNIQRDMNTFFTYYKTDYEGALHGLKDIYIRMFKLNNIFYEYHNL